MRDLGAQLRGPDHLSRKRGGNYRNTGRYARPCGGESTRLAGAPDPTKRRVRDRSTASNGCRCVAGPDSEWALRRGAVGTAWGLSGAEA